jgi:hypothetical protein
MLSYMLLTDNRGGTAAPSRIIVSVSGTGINQKDDSPSIINHVLSTSFTPTITHLRLYPPILFTHLSRAFLLPPPPRTPTAKFYSVFAAFSQRARREAEKLWYADLNGREARSGPEGRLETVMEVVVRPLGMRKSVERSLEGWIDGKGVCKLEDLQSLRECFAGSGLPTGSGSDTKVSFLLMMMIMMDGWMVTCSIIERYGFFGLGFAVQSESYRRTSRFAGESTSSICSHWCVTCLIEYA